jgi:DNA-binding IclR family transcriptional regulator
MDEPIGAWGEAGTPSAAGAGGIRAVERAFAALELLVAAAPFPVRVTHVAHHLEVNPATASRLLATLVRSGYASRTPDRRYTVGYRSVHLAMGWLARVQTAAGAPMAHVAQATGEIVVLCQLLGDRVVPIALRAPHSRAAVVVEDALPFALWATASGRALLAMLPAAQRARLLPMEEPYPALTARTATTWQEVRGAIRSGTRDGVFLEDGEVDSEISCAAVPLPGSDRSPLALCVILSGDCDDQQRGRVVTALRREGHQLGTTLSAVGRPARAESSSLDPQERGTTRLSRTRLTEVAGRRGGGQPPPSCCGNRAPAT